MFGKRRSAPKDLDETQDAEDFAPFPEEGEEAEEAVPEWEDSAALDDEEDFDDLRPQKRGSGLSRALPLLTAVVVGVVGLGMVYVNFIAPKGKDATGEAPAIIAATPAGTTDTATEGEAPTMLMPGTESGTTPEAPPEGAIRLSPATPTAAESQTAAETPPTPELSPMATSPLTGETVATLEPTVTASEASLTPTAETAPAETPAPVAAAPEAPAAPIVAEPPVAAAETLKVPDSTADSGMAAATADLSVRLDAMEKRLDQAVKAADRAPAAEQSALQALNQDVDQLRADLTKINSRLAALENRPQTTAAQAAPAPVAAVRPVVEATPEPTPAMTTPKPKAPVKAAAPKPAAPPAPKWVLRAAQPGEAWVSVGMAGDLRKVAVGDNLTGIGKIREIRQSGGRWEIVGSTGTIRQ